MTRLLILGGSDAGISAALRAREVDPSTQVTVVVADNFPNYSICGLPFYLSGEVPDYHHLAHRTADDITSQGIGLLLNHTARSIDPLNHTVMITDEADVAHQIEYDLLIIATGATPFRPAIAGADLPGVFLLRSMDESFAVHNFLSTHDPQSAIIIGGGYIGLEMPTGYATRF
jgi:NADPH-dependent 2,4-dienoyl-CoA reductase/sulfur reductase-like enzyme